MSRQLVALAVALALWGGGHAAAQESASVVGTVTDESKAVLPGVTVTATEVSSGRQYVAVSDTRGEYRLANVQPGTYRLQAELPGFATTVIPQLELLVGRRVTAPLVLTVATLEENVTVTGEAPLVDTRSTQVADNIDRRQMEELPIAGRNWMELSMMVKGVTSNDVSSGRPGTVRDDQYQINLDGQQMTQHIASANFGQPGLSREAIAEFQIVTNLFDITQGRSVGLQVQAISRSGTNNLSGAMYGYFRSDKFNAADHVAGAVLPFSNQQVGGALGGPIVQDRAHYFATYEYERQPNTWVFQPPGYSQQISLPSKVTKHSVLARGDYQLSTNNRLMTRYTTWYQLDPFGLARLSTAGNNHPTAMTDTATDMWSLNGTWTRVLSDSAVQEVKAGYFYYHFNFVPALGVPLVPLYNFSGVSIGNGSNRPEEFWQDSPSIRYDLSVHRGSHDFKIGGEFIKELTTGNWLNQIRGVMTFDRFPSDIERRFPLHAWNDSSQWDFTGLDSSALFFTQSFARGGPGLDGVREGNCVGWLPNYTGCGNWSLYIPRPLVAFWAGDTWRINNRLTVNYGVRYDLDWGASAPPYVRETDVLIDNRLFTENVGYRNDIRDVNNWSPRAGFNYDVSGDGRLVVRGGSGLYYSGPGSNMTFGAQLFNGQRVLTSQFSNDGRPGWVLDPTRGITNDDVAEGRVPLPPQSVTVFAHDYELPALTTSMIGVQKQLGSVMAVDADLVYSRGFKQGSARDPNLFFDPVSGYNVHPTRVGRPRPDYGSITLYEARGRSDSFQLASSFTRRFRDNWQAGMTYTLMFFRNDTGIGSQGYGGNADNHFDLDRSENFGRAPDFQRHTLRANGMFRLPANMTLAAVYFFGSGNYYQSTTGRNPFGSGAGRRLRTDGSIIPINDFKGDPIHKVDVRLTKEINLPGGVKVAGTAEVFNVLNRANFGGYNTVEGQANYGLPTQHVGTMFSPRTGQLGIRVSF